MTSIVQNRPLIKVGLVGLVLLPFLYLLNSYSPPPEKAPDGYNSTIIAFEMVSNEAELNQVLGPLTPLEIKGLDKLNYVDFGFMLTYGLFLFLFMSKFSEITGSNLLSKAKWLAPCIVLSDILENIQLLKLSKFTSESLPNIDTPINLLATFTWIKWLLLALSFSLIGMAMIKMKLSSKIVGSLLAIPLLLGLLAIVNGQNHSEDLFATSVFGAFFLVFGYSLLYKKSD